jgi:hypothetical protein
MTYPGDQVKEIMQSGLQMPLYNVSLSPTRIARAGAHCFAREKKEPSKYDGTDVQQYSYQINESAE